MLPPVRRQHACMHAATDSENARARARWSPCSRVPVLAHARMHCSHSRACSRAQTHVPGADPKSLRLLHLQVNLARLLNGLGDTTLLHPDNSALGITVRRSEQYDSLMEANGSMRIEIEKLRADLAELRAWREKFATVPDLQRLKALQRQTEDSLNLLHHEQMEYAREKHEWELEHLRGELQVAREKHEWELQNLRREHQHTLHILAASSCSACAARVTRARGYMG